MLQACDKSYTVLYYLYYTVAIASRHDLVRRRDKTHNYSMRILVFYAIYRPLPSCLCLYIHKTLGLMLYLLQSYKILHVSL